MFVLIIGFSGIFLLFCFHLINFAVFLIIFVRLNIESPYNPTFEGLVTSQHGEKSFDLIKRWTKVAEWNDKNPLLHFIGNDSG